MQKQSALQTDLDNHTLQQQNRHFLCKRNNWIHHQRDFAVQIICSMVSALSARC